jgi:predicted TIM-barrel fold metal-dependent hydrolase
VVIDGHCHAGPGDGFTGPWDTRACLKDYLPRAIAAGIHRTVVFAAFNRDYAAANRWVARLVQSRPSRFIGFVFVDAAQGRAAARMVHEYTRRFGFAGIKVHRHDAPLSREICDVARALRLPILYDPMGEVHPLGLIAREYPEVPLIIPHLGSFADDWRAHETVIDLLSRLPNVYTDTSGVRRFDYLREAVRRAGSHKVIFGTDGPFLHPALELEKIRLLGLPYEHERLVTGGNLSRLLLRAAPTRSRVPRRCHACLP